MPCPQWQLHDARLPIAAENFESFGLAVGEAVERVRVGSRNRQPDAMSFLDQRGRSHFSEHVQAVIAWGAVRA